MNSAPVLDSIANLTGAEGSAVNLAAAFADADTGDTHACTVDWGDNTALTNATVTEQDGAGSIAASHVYATYGSYNVLVALTDSSGDSQTDHATASPVALIDDVAPTLTISGDSSVDEGTTYTLNLSASDPGTETVNYWHINWGDNSDRDGDGVAGEVVQGNPSSVTHVYHKSSAAFQVTATATDDNGTYSADSMALEVAPLTVGEPGIVVHVDDGESIAGTNLVSYTVHLVADSSADAAVAWDGEFTGPLHQVWRPDVDNGPTPTVSLSGISRPDRLKDTHFLITPGSTVEPAAEDMLDQYTVTVDPDGIPDSWDEYDVNAITEGTGSSLSGAFAFQTATDRTFAQIVVESGQQVEMTGKVGNQYGEGWLTEVTIGGSQQNQSQNHNAPQRVQESSQGQDSQSNSPASQTVQADVLNSAPAVFIENDGQWTDSAARFALTGSAVNVQLTDDSIVLDLFRQQAADSSFGQQNYTTVSAEFTANFVGANEVTPIGLDQVSTIYSYSVGDQSAWRQDVPGFHTVEYQGLYDGIDLETFGRSDGLKYEFHVAPGSDYHQIVVHYQGTTGVSVDDQGALHIQTAFGEVVDNAPYIYQVVNGQQQQVAGAFTLVDSSTYSFTVTGQYDVTKPLVIDPLVTDPILQWSRYLVNADNYKDGVLSPLTYGNAIAVDSQDNVLVAGFTMSMKNGNPWAVAYVSKTDKDGKELWMHTFGGSGRDSAYGIAVDPSDNSVWVTGMTDSLDFANRSSRIGTGTDAFVAWMHGDGTGFNDGTGFQATWLGGNCDDGGYSIAIDGGGNAWITGDTLSSSSTFADGPGAFVALVHHDTGGVFSKYWAISFGGVGDSGEAARGTGIAFDRSAAALASGYTYALVSGYACGKAIIPIPSDYCTNAYSCEPTGHEAFVSKVRYNYNDNPQEPVWLTYVSTNATDTYTVRHFDTGAYAIAVDADGNALITGFAYMPRYDAGGYIVRDADVLLAKVDGVSGVYSEVDDVRTFGTTNNDEGRGIALDVDGNVVIAGYWGESNHPTADAFVGTVHGDVCNMVIFGGVNVEDIANGVAMSSGKRIAFVTGMTNCSTLPGHLNQILGCPDGFVSSIYLSPLPGDANLDGVVDVLDLGMLAAHWQDNNYTNGDTNRDGVVDWRDQLARGDFNWDYYVDVLDLGILATNWQKTA